MAKSLDVRKLYSLNKDEMKGIDDIKGVLNQPNVTIPQEKYMEAMASSEGNTGDWLDEVYDTVEPEQVVELITGEVDDQTGVSGIQFDIGSNATLFGSFGQKVAAPTAAFFKGVYDGLSDYKTKRVGGKPTKGPDKGEDLKDALHKKAQKIAYRKEFGEALGDENGGLKKQAAEKAQEEYEEFENLVPGDVNKAKGEHIKDVAEAVAVEKTVNKYNQLHQNTGEERAVMETMAKSVLSGEDYGNVDQDGNFNVNEEPSQCGYDIEGIVDQVYEQIEQM